MPTVQLRAGDISVTVQTEDEDLATTTQAAHTEMQYLMKQWSEVSGEVVTVSHNDYSIE